MFNHFTFIMKILIRVQNINFTVYNLFEYVIMNFYILEIMKLKLKITAHIVRKLHVIDILKTKIFIKIDILNLKEINILISFKFLIIQSCKDFLILIIIVFKNNRVKRLIKAFS